MVHASPMNRWAAFALDYTGGMVRVHEIAHGFPAGDGAGFKIQVQLCKHD